LFLLFNVFLFVLFKLAYLFLENLCIENPSNPPRIVVIIAIGIRVNGSLQPINIAEGNKTKNANSIPLTIELISNLNNS